jgi:hypothetical protein
MREWIQAILWVVRSEKPDDPTEDTDTFPPFDLSFGGVVEPKPPEMQFRGGRFRVSLFPQKEGDDRRCHHCERPFRWLVMEFLNNKKRWQHLLTLHESNYGVMLEVFDEVSKYLEELTDEFEREKKRAE